MQEGSFQELNSQLRTHRMLCYVTGGIDMEFVHVQEEANMVAEALCLYWQVVSLV